MWVTKQFLVPTDFLGTFFPSYGNQWLPRIVWLSVIFMMFFYVQQKKQTHTGLEQLQGEFNDDRFLIFPRTIPLITLLFHKCKAANFCGHEFNS